MRKRLFFPLSLFILLAALTGCDSSDLIATVTARADGTATAAVTLTALAQITPTRSPTPAPPPTEALVETPTAAATAQPTAEPATEQTMEPTQAATHAPSTAEPTQAATAPATAMNGVQGRTKAETPVRAHPSLTVPTLGRIPGDQTVSVVGRYRQWLQIRFDQAPDGLGWVNAGTLTITSGSVDALPEIDVAALPAAATPTPVPAVAQVDPNTGWFRDAVLYSLFVRSFRDSNGDGIGDLQGVINGLDYIQSLGVDTIWLLPVFEGPTYHGYQTVDYYQVESDYGTNADLLRLIREMRARNMRLLLDYVANHTSSRHPMFVDAFGNPNSPYAEFYLWRNEAHTDYAYFGPDRGMPRLNYDSRKTRDYMINVALHWLDPNGDGDPSDGVDGFRCDVAGDVPVNFWVELRAAMNRVNPRAILLGEVWRDGSEIVRYLRGDAMTSSFDFPSYMLLTGHHDHVGDGLLNGNADPAVLRTIMLSLDRQIAPTTFAARFVSNHDTNRLMSDVQGNMARARMAAVWLMTAPGTPTLYYGEEIGMKGVKGNGPSYWDEYRREPLDWYARESGPEMTTWFRPADRNNRPGDGISVEEQAQDPASLLAFYRRLGKLRIESEALRRGSTEIARDQPGLYVLQRWTDDELYIVAINFMKEPRDFTRVSAYFSAGGRNFDPATLETVLMQTSIRVAENTYRLAPGGYLVLRLRR